MLTTYRILRGTDRIESDKLSVRRETGTRGHNCKLNTYELQGYHEVFIQSQGGRDAE